MGKFRSNLIPTGKPPKKTIEQREAEDRLKLQRMVIRSDRVRSNAPKVTLPRMSWEASHER